MFYLSVAFIVEPEISEESLTRAELEEAELRGKSIHGLWELPPRDVEERNLDLAYGKIKNVLAENTRVFCLQGEAVTVPGCINYIESSLSESPGFIPNFLSPKHDKFNT